jgi:uncharacterized protein (DUF433 family)
MSMKTLDQYIEVTPGVAGGKPRIAGHRITVQDIAIWHERLGKSPDEIAAEYNLSLAAVYAALAYYFDHRAEIDRTIEEGQAFAEAVRQRTPSKLLRKLQEQPPRGPED